MAADSGRSRRSTKSLPVRRLNATGFTSLCLLANRHGVLPAVLRQIECLLRDEPAKLLADVKGFQRCRRPWGGERPAGTAFGDGDVPWRGDAAAGWGACRSGRGNPWCSRARILRPAFTHPSPCGLFGDIDLLVHMGDWKAWRPPWRGWDT